jgi:hypothetical protein
VRVTTRFTDGQILISVRDTGPGIPTRFRCHSAGSTFHMELPFRGSAFWLSRTGRIYAPSARFSYGLRLPHYRNCSGVEGVTKARSESPALILLDIQLPVLGYDKTRQIKALPGHVATPIVGVSQDGPRKRSAAECG